MNQLNQVSLLVVDNEQACREELITMLGHYNWACVVDEAEDGLMALRKISHQHVDVVFLDIEMPYLNGIEVARNIAGKKPLIIFVTAFDKYAIEAFELHAVDYLLKPITKDRLSLCMEHIKTRLLQKKPYPYESFLEHQDSFSSSRKITLLEGKEMTVISMDDIIFITMESRYTRVVLKNRDIFLAESLSSLFSKLDASHFLFIHRHTVVNMFYATGIKRKALRNYHLLLDHPTVKDLPIARLRLTAVKDWLTQENDRI